MFLYLLLKCPPAWKKEHSLHRPSRFPWTCRQPQDFCQGDTSSPTSWCQAKTRVSISNIFSEKLFCIMLKSYIPEWFCRNGQHILCSTLASAILCSHRFLHAKKFPKMPSFGTFNFTRSLCVHCRRRPQNLNSKWHLPISFLQSIVVCSWLNAQHIVELGLLHHDVGFREFWYDLGWDACKLIWNVWEG